MPIEYLNPERSWHWRSNRDLFTSEQNVVWGENDHGEEKTFNLPGPAVTDTGNGSLLALARRPSTGDWGQRKKQHRTFGHAGRYESDAPADSGPCGTRQATRRAG